MHACTSGCSRIYHTAPATCGLWDFWLGLWANEHSCFELTVISWLQLRVSSCCWISWSRLSSRLHSFISFRTFSPGRRSPSQLQSASGAQSWCATDTTGSHKKQSTSHRWTRIRRINIWMKTASQLIRIYGVNVYSRPSRYGLSEKDEHNCVYFTLKALNCWNPEGHIKHTPVCTCTDFTQRTTSKLQRGL